MAKLNVADNLVGKKKVLLTAGQPDEVAFSDSLRAVEVWSDGTADLYFTVDGSDASVKGDNTYELPAGAQAARTVLVPSSSPRKNTTVKLISAGTPRYSVSRVVIG